MPSASQPYVGFEPREISTMTHRAVIDEHASEAAFLWRLRTSAADAPHYTLLHFHKLDMRLIAHLCGLEIAGAAGLRAAQRNLEDAGPGTVFVAAFVAFAMLEPNAMAEVLALLANEPRFEKPVRTALAWQQESAMRAVLAIIGRSRHVQHRKLALAAAIARRQASFARLDTALRDEDAGLRAIALRGIGVLALRSLAREAEAALRDPDPACRFWAAWTLVLFGDARHCPALMEAGDTLPPLRLAALDMSMRRGDPRWIRGTIRALASNDDERRLALRAAGAFGDPASVPWLLNHADDPACARAAGAAFSLITGADLDYDGLKRPPPADAPEANPDDDDLDWPDPPRVHAWWQAERGRFTAGTRHLRGQPVCAAQARRVLAEGYQRQRTAAALELSLSDPALGLFPVRDRTDRQHERLRG
ncbi:MULTISPECIES: TIGR02270 family protein [unclassified Caballeronia]|uniref:TIGR02270 family protein n=1 Tax=unclassified Caballeronia TaxID=2646786 RepID=UPI001F38094A|nr:MULTISPECIES: TIGR02270 family protein [unclassified Caballeronia]MCE4545715.1 TIGR02270 family protein [Caballeronia sp. PC1]MCE4572163.1 TIGR02270 family protein [Caballeronia sp. CLC5]